MDPTLFSAMAPSMGVFGAVIEVEVEVVPLQILVARMTVVSFDEMIECFEDVMKSNNETSTLELLYTQVSTKLPYGQPIL